MDRAMSDPAPPDMRRLALASITGTALEYYDFAVYNTLAALVFNQLFFPSYDPLSGTLLSFSTFWLGYIARPFGGVLFGHLGDRRGRRYVLVVTLLLMGVCSVLIGLLPTYARIGALAPVLLVALRFVQGMALGGEWAGAVLLSMEHGSDANRGRNAAFAQMGPALGVLLASGVIALVSATVSQQDLLAWGWRLPLVASVVLIGFGLWVRLRITETPQFLEAQRAAPVARAPLGEVLTRRWRGLLVAGGSRVGPDVLFSLVAVFSLTYVTTILGLSPALATTALSVGAACNAVSVPIAGILSDRFGRRQVYGLAAMVSLAWLFALFPLLDTGNPIAIVLAIASGLIVHAFMYGPQAAFIAEQFPTRVRYAGASLAYTFAGVFAGGIAPLVFTALYARYRATIPVVLYAAGAVLVTLLALAGAGNTHRRAD
jgi:MFS family permease